MIRILAGAEQLTDDADRVIVWLPYPPIARKVCGGGIYGAASPPMDIRLHGVLGPCSLDTDLDKEIGLPHILA